MKTTEIAQEKISAFADGEATEQEADLALLSLRTPERQADWELYHRIGDVLRSDDMDVPLSSGFAARMAARLESEPAIVAPARVTELSDKGGEQSSTKNMGSAASPSTAQRLKRFALPGVLAASAFATIAFVTTPHLMVAHNDAAKPAVVASSAATVEQAREDTIATVSSVPSRAPIAASVPEGVVLRDAYIDDYLLAHQRFSPSVYSTAQYARSATFATKTEK